MVDTHQDTERALAMLDERIAQLAELETDWDSYGARSIAPEAIAAARDVLRTVIQITEPTIGERVLSVWIAPLPNGGVLLEWHGPTADLEVEVTANGALDLLLEKRAAETYTSSERTDVRVEDVASLLGGVLSA